MHVVEMNDERVVRMAYDSDKSANVENKLRKKVATVCNNTPGYGSCLRLPRDQSNTGYKLRKSVAIRSQGLYQPCANAQEMIVVPPHKLLAVGIQGAAYDSNAGDLVKCSSDEVPSAIFDRGTNLLRQSRLSCARIARY